MEQQGHLKRTLGRFNLVSLGVGAIIGAGIFVITGQAAANYAGPGIIISFILSGIACVFAALCYAEFAAMIPIAGSAYTYSRATLGKTFSWIIGWDLILEYLFCASTVAVGWSGYMQSFLKDIGIVLPKALASSPYIYDATGWHHSGALINLPAMIIIALITAFLYVGIKESANLNNIIVFIKVSVILLFIVFGAFHFVPENWVPFIPENTGKFGHFGWSGIFRAAGVIFFAYVGFDAVSTAAQEAKNPQKDMPFGIILSLLVSTVLYILVALVLTGIVNFTKLGVPDPIAVAVDAAGPSLVWLRPFIKLGAIAGLSSVILVMLMGQARIFYAMARDGFLPNVFSSIHKKFNTPHLTTLISGFTAMIIAGFLPLGILGELVSIGTLLAFIMVCLGIWVLRKKSPNLPRPFRTPFVPLIPILGALFAFLQMLFLPWDTWLRLILWMVLGMLIYAFYGRKHYRNLPVMSDEI